jgi:DNA-binding transcriptional regulator YbjK
MTTSTPDSRPRRPRRFDPQRSDRILDAALEVIREQGAGRLTHRLVAAAADVPLGSVTYHFRSKQALLRAAFERFVAQQDQRFAARFAAVSSHDDLVECLFELVRDAPTREESGVLGFELHLAALRDVELRKVTAAWTERSRQVLAQFVGHRAAEDLDVYLEGLILHGLLGMSSGDEHTLRASILRLVPTRIERTFGEEP